VNRAEDPIENEFAVESPNQLRGTITDQVLDVTEKDCRREIAREWEQSSGESKLWVLPSESGTF